MLRRKLFFLALVLTLALVMLSVNAFAAETETHTCVYENGFCTTCDAYEPAVLNGDVYEISNAGQLYWFAAQVNGGDTSINGKLMADIVVNENVLNADGTLNGDGSNFRVWTPIGYYNSGSDCAKYAGTFDGNGKIVSGLYFNDTSADYVGLFSFVGSGGKVQNVGVVDSYLSGRNDVGGVVGDNYSTVSNCHNAGSVDGTEDVGGVMGINHEGTAIGCYNIGTISGNSYVGAVAGHNTGGTITDCYNTGRVCGGNYCGGLMGESFGGSVSNCYNTGAVSGNSSVGGLVGDSHSAISNCYNTGTVSGSENVGGLVGISHQGTICNSYNTGEVRGCEMVGGALGYNFFGTVTDCYNTGAVSGSDDNVGGVVGYNKSGTVSNCYYLSGCVSNGNTDGTTMTAAQFASGEVAYLLQGEQTEQVWGQLIGAEISPVLGGEKVYGANGHYYNDCDHYWEGGSCTQGVSCIICGAVGGYAPGHQWTDATCTTPKTCSVCGATEGHALGHMSCSYGYADGVHNLTCPMCGITETVTATDGKQFKFNTAAPTLSDDIVMNIATTLPAGFSDSTMVVEFNGVTTTITDYTINESNGRYVFAFAGLNSQTMGDTFHATLCACVDGVRVTVELDYSVLKYINSQLKKDISAELRTALSDLVMYGEYNQIYEGYKTDALLSTLLESTATLTPSTFTALDDTYNKQVTAGTKDANIDLKGISLTLGSKIVARLTVYCADPSAYSVKVSINGQDHIFPVSELALADGYTDRYVVSFDQIRATQFGEVITFSFLDADGNQVGRTLEYSVYTYVQKNQGSSDTNLVNLLQAIYNYGEAVKKI